MKIVHLNLYKNLIFGSNIIINDISKIIGFDFEITQKIIGNLNLSDDEYLEKDFFKNKNFRKIKKNYY